VNQIEVGRRVEGTDLEEIVVFRCVRHVSIIV
jgi:hypothetical protein